MARPIVSSACSYLCCCGCSVSAAVWSLYECSVLWFSSVCDCLSATSFHCALCAACHHSCIVAAVVSCRYGCCCLRHSVASSILDRHHDRGPIGIQPLPDRSDAIQTRSPWKRTLVEVQSWHRRLCRKVPARPSGASWPALFSQHWRVYFHTRVCTQTRMMSVPGYSRLPR